MLAKAQRWGNSLAVRLPKVIAEECGISEDTPVEVTRKHGSIIISPVKPRRKYSLDEMLAGVTDENLHAEVATDGPVGRETW